MYDLILTICTQGLPVCLMAIGIFLTFRLLDFADMTAEGSFLIGGAITVVAINAGINPFIATLFAFLGGAACGAFTGFLNRILKVPKLLSGIITMTACGGIFFLILGYSEAAASFKGSATLSLNAPTIYSWLQNLFPSVTPYLLEIIVMVAIVLIVLFAIYFFFGTEYGMAIRATGMNERMARAQGINTTATTIVCIAISNAIIAVASSMVFQEGAEIKVGVESGRLVIGLAAVLIGEAIFGKRSFKNWLISITLGAFIYYAIVTLCLNIGNDTFKNVMDKLQKLMYAVLIIFALCLPMIKEKISKRKMKKSIEKELAKEEITSVTESEEK